MFLNYSLRAWWKYWYIYVPACHLNEEPKPVKKLIVLLLLTILTSFCAEARNVTFNDRNDDSLSCTGINDSILFYRQYFDFEIWLFKHAKYKILYEDGSYSTGMWAVGTNGIELFKDSIYSTSQKQLAFINYEELGLKVNVKETRIPLSTFRTPQLPNNIQTYEFSDNILYDYYHDKSEMKYDIASWDLSNIGEYEALLCIWDTGQYFNHMKEGNKEPQATNRTLLASDSLYFSKFKPYNAIDYISERSKKEKIIIINEAHQQPMHRVFTESLLQELYNNGFRYFGAETLGYFDSKLNQREYPILTSGTYTVEPQYGNLVRAALKIGYHVFSYESKSRGDPAQREIDQANNIRQMLLNDSSAKIIIHCGFGHNNECYMGGQFVYAMAGRLKEITGIDPLTINQIAFTETSSEVFDNPYFKQIDANYDAVFIDSVGQIFSINPSAVDMYVYHPRTKWLHGRPDWVFKNSKIPTPILNLITVGFPCLVFAYLENEDIENAVPVDVIEIRSDSDDKYLALYKGNYIVVVKDKQGRRQEIKISNH